MKRPREKTRGRRRVMSVMHADMKKAPAVLVTVGAGARGLLDDLHAGADAFRGDVDGP